MYRQVHTTIKKGLFDLFDKKPLAAHLGQRHIQYFVSLGFDDREGDLAAGMGFSQAVFDPVGLPQSEFAAAGADAKRLSHQ
mgnify:CR=1 FL=1